MLSGFQECAECAARPGSSALCPSCLRNRTAIERLTQELASTKAELERVEVENGKLREEVNNYEKYRLAEVPKLQHQLARAQADCAAMYSLVERAIKSFGTPYKWSYAIFVHFCEEGNELLRQPNPGQPLLDELQRYRERENGLDEWLIAQAARWEAYHYAYRNVQSFLQSQRESQ